MYCEYVAALYETADFLDIPKSRRPLSSRYLRHLCRPCHNREKARGLGKYICQKCHAIIEEQPLIFKNDPYHPDHFNCNNCGSVSLLHSCSVQKTSHYSGVRIYLMSTLSLTDDLKPPMLSLCVSMFSMFTGRS